MPRPRFSFLLLAIMSVATIGQVGAEPLAQVAIIADPARLPGDANREGSAEMAILIQLAQLQKKSPTSIGVIGVGNDFGVFHHGTHRALELAVEQGMPVVRLSRTGRQPASAPQSLFINGGQLDQESARRLLAHCLDRFGPFPRNAASAAWRAQHHRYQTEFNQAEARLPQS